MTFIKNFCCRFVACKDNIICSKINVQTLLFVGSVFRALPSISMSAGISSQRICISKARTLPMHSASCKFSAFTFFGFVGVVASILLPINPLAVTLADDGAVFDVDGPWLRTSKHKKILSKYPCSI